MQFPLFDNLFFNKGINVKRRFFGKYQMCYLDGLFLTDPHGTCDGLIHHCRRPPWRHEDYMVELLEVQTDAPALDLDEENLMRRLFGLGKNSGSLLLCQGSMVKEGRGGFWESGC